MNALYCFPVCPFSRKVRVFLREKGIEFSTVEENPWKRREGFIKINPVCQVPVLISGQHVISDSQAACEYMEEINGDVPLLGKSPYERAQVRRMIYWLDNKFYHEVTRYVIHEKVAKYYMEDSSPNPKLLRASTNNLQSHIRYLEHLIDINGWLALHEFTLADIALSAHISLLDYMNLFPWNLSTVLKDWYALVKSKPSFAQILYDRIPGFTPPTHYSQLDF